MVIHLVQSVRRGKGNRMPDYRATVWFDVVRSDGEIWELKKVVELTANTVIEFTEKAQSTIINTMHPQATNFQFGPISKMR